jgi:hypothetical protein
MDSIYIGSLLTIIATAGDSETAGLPGLEEGTRAVNQGILMVGEKLYLLETVAPGESSHVKNSRWHSRGWTFQE